MSFWSRMFGGTTPTDTPNVRADPSRRYSRSTHAARHDGGGTDSDRRYARRKQPRSGRVTETRESRTLVIERPPRRRWWDCFGLFGGSARQTTQIDESIRRRRQRRPRNPPAPDTTSQQQTASRAVTGYYPSGDGQRQTGTVESGDIPRSEYPDTTAHVDWGPVAARTSRQFRTAIPDHVRGDGSPEKYATKNPVTYTVQHWTNEQILADYWGSLPNFEVNRKYVINVIRTTEPRGLGRVVRRYTFQAWRRNDGSDSHNEAEPSDSRSGHESARAGPSGTRYESSPTPTSRPPSSHTTQGRTGSRAPAKPPTQSGARSSESISDETTPGRYSPERPDKSSRASTSLSRSASRPTERPATEYGPPSPPPVTGERAPRAASQQQRPPSRPRVDRGSSPDSSTEKKGERVIKAAEKAATKTGEDVKDEYKRSKRADTQGSPLSESSDRRPWYSRHKRHRKRPSERRSEEDSGKDGKSWAESPDRKRGENRRAGDGRAPTQPYTTRGHGYSDQRKGSDEEATCYRPRRYDSDGRGSIPEGRFTGEPVGNRRGGSTSRASRPSDGTQEPMNPEDYAIRTDDINIRSTGPPLRAQDSSRVAGPSSIELHTTSDPPQQADASSHQTERAGLLQRYIPSPLSRIREDRSSRTYAMRPLTPVGDIISGDNATQASHTASRPASRSPIRSNEPATLGAADARHLSPRSARSPNRISRSPSAEHSTGIYLTPADAMRRPSQESLHSGGVSNISSIPGIMSSHQRSSTGGSSEGDQELDPDLLWRIRSGSSLGMGTLYGCSASQESDPDLLNRIRSGSSIGLTRLDARAASPARNTMLKVPDDSVRPRSSDETPHPGGQNAPPFRLEVSEAESDHMPPPIEDD